MKYVELLPLISTLALVYDQNIWSDQNEKQKTTFLVQEIVS